MSAEPHRPIDSDIEFDRHYIPMPGGWEVQTKGSGSTFRIADTKTGERLAIPESPYLHETLERMAREVSAAWSARPSFDMDAAGEAALTAYYCNDKLDIGWGPEARGDMRTALTAALPHLHDESVRRDNERLDALERMANQPGGILLHDGTEAGRTGLGLRPGTMNRTLRQAIDAAIRAEKEASNG